MTFIVNGFASGSNLFCVNIMSLVQSQYLNTSLCKELAYSISYARYDPTRCIGYHDSFTTQDLNPKLVIMLLIYA